MRVKWEERTSNADRKCEWQRKKMCTVAAQGKHGSSQGGRRGLKPSVKLPNLALNWIV